MLKSTVESLKKRSNTLSHKLCELLALQQVKRQHSHLPHTLNRAPTTVSRQPDNQTTRQPLSARCHTLPHTATHPSHSYFKTQVQFMASRRAPKGHPTISNHKSRIITYSLPKIIYIILKCPQCPQCPQCLTVSPDYIWEVYDCGLDLFLCRCENCMMGQIL